MKRLRFSRSLRLRKSADFRRVQQGGRRVVTGELVVVYQPRPDAGPRFGLAVSRKVGNAVVRNRVKRWLRESIRVERGALSEVDVVFIARKGAAVSGLAELRLQVRGALDRIRRALRQKRT
ncbi:MAG: ribonuclease P protein component [Deltaproteobacteria bacterium]|nr:ribonuclease P protein component [Deltaproteobacteria bacterium]